MSLLSLKGVRKEYHSGDETIHALDGIDVTIEDGSFVAIIGQSGSGKSTLMQILGCLDTPTSGEYYVNGQNIAACDSDALAALRRDYFGFVFQRYHLITTATAQHNVEIPAIYAGQPQSSRHARAAELLEKMGLGDRMGHRPSQLSGGQQQRVAIARALVNSPHIILADEPTGALDSRSGAEMMAILKQLHAQGQTIILITHDAHVASHADRIITLKDGKIIEDITTHEAAPVQFQNSPPQNRTPKLATSLYEAIGQAMTALHVNRFRTLLTLLGIIIGIAAVIVMLGIGNGSKAKILKQISAMGTNLLIIRPGQAGFRGGGDIVTLVPEDASEIARIEGVEALIPERTGRYTVRAGNIDAQTSIQASGVDLPLVRDWSIAEGAFFTERDMKSSAPVAVIGKTVAQTLFGSQNPVGKTLLVKTTPFEIIGVLSPKGASLFGTDQDDVVIIPLSTGFIRLFGKPYLNSITVRVADTNNMENVQETIRNLLLARHRTEDFNIRNMSSILTTATETQNSLTLLLAAVATISLLVGGIGVMNIMLVTVTERTREIGVRMATGARQRDIMLQFMTEAITVCLLGGVMGILIGLAIGIGLRGVGMNVMFTPAPPLLAFLSAFLTGVIFGYLPARQAARLNPVIALASD